jgi:RHS repeat-associated protein
VQGLDGREQERDQLIVNRTDPAAVADRLLSRTRYEHLSAGAAVGVIGRDAPAVVSESPAGFGTLPPGARVSRYLSTTSARLELPGGKRAIVESMAPAATRTRSGGYAPVNLTLHEMRQGFAAENSAVPVSIPRELAAGVSLDASAVSLIPLDVAGAPTRGSGRIDGNAVIYPNTAKDTDTAAKPTAGGMELYGTLRSAESPQVLSYKVGMPRGASLVSGKSGMASVVAYGRPLAVIAPASAVDAAGTPVPVSTTVSGDTLELKVDHRSGDYLYPIIVDPTVIDSSTSWFPNWRFEKGGPAGVSHGGIIWSSYWNITFPYGTEANQWGAVVYPTQGESHIYEVSMETSASTGSNVENHLVIAGAGGWEASTALAKSYGRSGASVCVSSCSSTGGTAANIAAYWVNAIASTPEAGEVVGYQTSVYIAQSNGPAIVKDTTKERGPDGFYRNAFYHGGNEWISPGGQEAVFDLSDPGVGVDEVQYTVGATKWGYKLCESGAQCTPSTSTRVIAIEGTRHLPEGEETIEAKALNAMGSSATTTATIKVDSAAPHEITLTGLPTSNVINDATQGGVKLVAHATDGVTGTLSSGVGSLKLSVDGREVGSANGSCSPGPCTATGEWTINGEEFAVGEHTLTVTATDVVGNVATSNTNFSVHHANPVSFGPGELNPVTGEFDLEETDASVSTIGGALSVVRGYDSREPTSGGVGSFGAPWSLSVGGTQQLVRFPNGNVTLVSATGSQSTFTATGGGKYEPPTGDTGLVLSANAGETEYTLKDNGASTVFKHVSGDTESVYRASVVSGTVGSNTTQYTYQSVGGVVEPEEELGPVPAGVSCTPTLNPGCRALTFNYASSTTATGEGSSQWGDYTGRLTRVYFTTGEEKEGKVVQVVKTVAQYAYDNKGRLRAEWDPRISPALKTTYGYDSEGHVTVISPAGKESWAFTYGTTSTDTRPGRLIKAMRPPASEALWGGEVLKNTGAPTLSGSPIVRVRLTASNGSWSGGPVAYGYQWQDCNSAGGECKAIGGATNANYTPVSSDIGHTLVAQVTATSGGGSVAVNSSPSAVVVAAAGSGFASVTQSIESNALNAVTCVPGTSDCVVSDSKGNAYYASNVSATAAATWTSWSGPGTSPSEALSCPSTSLCVIADGEKSGFGGTLYYSTSLGGSWTQAANPAYGADAISCVSASFCVAGQNNYGYFRYSTSPASSSWTLEEQGTAAMKSVYCLSTSFCAIGDGAGKVHVATSTAQIESSTWKQSSVDGTTALNGVACTSTSACIAVDAAGNVLNLAINSSGEATATKQNIDGSNSLTAVTCTGTTCVTVDNQGNVFVSTDSGKTWSQRYQLKHGLTSVSCASTVLCATVDTSGNLTAFNPNSVQPVESNGINAVACVPGTTDCVISDSNGGAYYSTNMSVSAPATWTSWSGPSGMSPSEALSCPTSTLCVMADGSKEGYGGNLYYASALGGAWTQAVAPTYGADAISCASSSFCVSGHDGLGYYRYSTKPASTTWTLKKQGGYAMKSVFCLSSSFCAMVDSHGVLYVGTSTSKIEGELTESNVDVGTSLNGVACTSTTSCVAVDAVGNVLNLTVGSSGEASATKQDIDETNSLTAVTCSGTSCVTVDNHGNIFGSTDSGKTWLEQYALKDNLTSVSCASSKLCATVDTTGHLFAFDPTAVVVSEGEARSPQPGMTVEYNVPVSGSGAPYSLSSTEASKWAQADTPVEATAIFPADEPVGWPSPDYRRATIDYLDINDRVVNAASPGGAITTSEYNTHNDVVRNLSADDRAAALKEGSKAAEVSQTLDTQSTYNGDGTELLTSLGPLHTVKLASGAVVKARLHTAYSYDEGAPEGGTYRLVTKVTEGAQISGEPEADVRTTTKSYAGQNNLGWTLREPTATTVDPAGLKLVYSTVYDPTTGKVTETRTPAAGAADESYVGYQYSSDFGSEGSGNGQVNEAAGIAMDSEGNIWIADTYNNRIEEFSSAGTFIQKFGGPSIGEGELNHPSGLAIDKSGNIWVTNTGKNRVAFFSKTGTYLGKWGEGVLKEPIGLAYSNYNNRLYVTDAGDGRVLEFKPEVYGEYTIIGKKGTGNGEFSYPEGIVADSSGNIYVTDTSRRVQKFSAAGAYISQFASEHMSGPDGIAFDSKGNILIADGWGNDVQSYSPSGVYQYEFGLGGSLPGQFKDPTGIVLDGSDDMFVIDTNNNRIEKWLPSGGDHKSRGNGGTHGMQTVYYTAGTNSEVSACGNRAEWAGMPCEKRPAAQPETSGVPNLPVTTITYNVWEEPLVSTETVGSATRTNTDVYDEAGRMTKDTVSSSVGTALPSVEYEYNPETGYATKSKTTVEGTTRTLESVYDKRGELSSYKDADGNTASFYYDPYGRLESLNDGKGTQTYTYDTTTGLPSKLVDSAAGTFTGTYDAEGNLTTTGYPNGMNVNHTYDATGSETGVEYVKTTHCSSGCTWFSQSESPSIHRQTLSQSSTLSSQSYTYDAAGRLTKTQDTPAGEGCTTRIYAYDQETNVNSLTTRPPGTGGVCATEGGTALNHTYDTANRLTDTGIAYDSFGDVTKLSAADAGGNEVTSTFYADETLASQVQNGQTLGYNLDPEGRDRQIVSTGTINSTVTYHYAGDGSSPAWTEDTAGKWTRNIYGFEGLVATQAGGESPILQVQDLKGNIVGTMSASETATGLLSKGDTTEYGVPRTSSPPKYSWQGASALRTELPSGIVAMGARSYLPQIGRFLQPDPIEGGSANEYAYTYGDPINSSDPSGEYTVATPTWVSGFFNEQAEVATEAAIQKAAEEQAAREEAEEKAREAIIGAAEAAEAAEAATEAYTGGGKKGKAAKSAKASKVKPGIAMMVHEGGFQGKDCKRPFSIRCGESGDPEGPKPNKPKGRAPGCPGPQADYRVGDKEFKVSSGLYYGGGQSKVINDGCLEGGDPTVPCEVFGCGAGTLGAWQQWPDHGRGRKPNEQPLDSPRQSIRRIRV